MKIVKFAILGFGGAGRAHLQRLNCISGVDVRVVFDPKIDHSSDMAKSYRGIKFTKSLDFIEKEKLDAISICTPDHTHFEYAKIGVKKGLHTLIEKPMFISKKQCDEMEDLLKDNNVVFGVHHQMRYIPTFKNAHKLTREGALGDILAIEADYIHDMRQRASKFDNWRLDKQNPQNIVLGGLSHTLDLIQWIANEKVEEIFGLSAHKGWKEYPDEDTVYCLLKFPSGLIGKSSITISSSGPQRNRLSIYGTRGQIHNNLLIKEDGMNTFLVEPNQLLNWKKRIFCKAIRKNKSVTNFPFSVYVHDHACKELLKDFVAAVLGLKKFPIGLSEGRAAVEICLRCIESYKTQKVDHRAFQKGISNI